MKINRRVIFTNTARSALHQCIDRDKSFASAFVQSFPVAHSIGCLQHRADNLCKHGTKGDVSTYLKALTAPPTPEELEAIKKEYSPKGFAYMAKTPDKVLNLYDWWTYLWEDYNSRSGRIWQ